MVVKLKKDEIFEACVEWAMSHHGLSLSGDPVVMASIREDAGGRLFSGVAHEVAVTFPEAKGSQGPYREPPRGGR